MKSQKWLFLTVALVLIAGTAGALTWLRANQKLAAPGLRVTPIPGKIQTNITLPERVLDFTSTNIPEPAVVLGYLPEDTSYAERLYTGPSGIQIQNAAVLMGTDRTSIHRPEYCLPGQGWTIGKKEVVTIPINDNPSYDLQVARWNLTGNFQQPNGERTAMAGIYVFWYVAKNDETPDHDKMIEHLTLNLFRTGDLQRWAYISYYVPCLPGQEDAAFAETKRLIAAEVPQFELPLQQK